LPLLRLLPRPRGRSKPRGLRRLWRRAAAAVICAASLALVTVPARAQSTEELRREIEQLSGAPYANATSGITFGVQTENWW
jgi:hypothetical protein